MNKKLSIIMLLSCVGNVISSEAAKTNKEKLKELPGVIYCSTVDAAKKVGSAINTKPGVALVSSACTLSGYQVYQLPKVQNAISVAKRK